MEKLHTGETVGFRGMAVLNDSVVWLSGAGGKVLLTKDGGRTWYRWTVDPECDFRDIHAFTTKEAVVMSSGFPARIYRTSDGGKNWDLTFFSSDPKMFLDGMDFSGDGKGVVFGDPLDGQFYLLRSSDRGKTWTETGEIVVKPDLAEAGFAASGTSIAMIEGNIYFGTGGGPASRILVKDEANQWKAITTPMRQGEGAGIFSITALGKDTLLAVGGAYQDSASCENNFIVSFDQGNNWTLLPGPSGYRSCICLATNGEMVFATGTTGVDFARTDDLIWSKVPTEGFHVCDASDHFLWLAGSKGRVARVSINSLEP